MSEPACWRLLDTGLRRAADHVAINRVMLNAHQAGKVPNTLRFMRFAPCALLGFHQSASQELRLDYCGAHGIDIQRRLSGGGAVYCDPDQIAWELCFDRRHLGLGAMADIASCICGAAATGIRGLGVNARFRPRNDIEVDGRKISGTGGILDGNTVIYQGTLLIDFNVERMLKVLRIPAEKLTDKAVASAGERVTSLAEQLGYVPALDGVKHHLANAFADEFNIAFEPANEIDAVEQRTYREALAEIDTDEWVYQHYRPTAEAPTLEGVYRASGGLMRVNVSLDTRRRRIRQVWFHGDFFVQPRRTIYDLEAALRGAAVTDVKATIERFFAHHRPDLLMLAPRDFSNAVAIALASVGAPEVAQ
ncbi:MAG: lipoate--protein ligase family protein [Pseudomonadota bacterium]|nr:MAG: lipoate--protein ligase family protein [Pseudomonadota bacterium]